MLEEDRAKKVNEILLFIKRSRWVSIEFIEKEIKEKYPEINDLNINEKEEAKLRSIIDRKRYFINLFHNVVSEFYYLFIKIKIFFMKNYYNILLEGEKNGII